MGVVTVVTDRISGRTIDLVVSHIAAIQIDQLGINSSRAYTITMSGGWCVRCDKESGERVRKSLGTSAG